MRTDQELIRCQACEIAILNRGVSVVNDFASRGK